MDGGVLKLNLAPESVLVLEDALAGIRAGKAAGFRVVAARTSHSLEQLQGAGRIGLLRICVVLGF